MNTKIPSAGRRDLFLDLLKVASALLIAWHHYQQVFEVRFETVNFYGGLFNCGYLVELFFMVSGFLAAQSLLRHPRPIVADFVRRALRLYPIAAISCAAYLVVLLLYDHLFGASLFPMERHDAANIVRSFLLILQPPGQFALNNPSWYLCVLLQCFLAMELLRWAGRRARKAEPFLSAVMAALSSIAFLVFPASYFSATSGRGLVPFFLGMALFRFMRAGISQRHLAALAAFLLTAAFVILLVFPHSAVAHQQYLLVYLVYPAILYVGLTSKRYINNSYIYIYMSYGSAASFGVYLWHFPIYAAICLVGRAAGVEVPHTPLAMCVVTVLVASWSLLSYAYVEKPIASRMQRLEDWMEKKWQTRCR